MRRFLIAGVMGLPLLGLAAGCREEPPAPVSASPAAARPVSQAPQLPPRPAKLVAKGQLAYQGDSELRCVLHDEAGLQLNMRTGDPDLPAVAVRIASYQGPGSYQGELFVTGRAGSGALQGSQGTVEVTVEQPRPADASGASVLAGSFSGRYAGEAGAGALEGRFTRCFYRPLQAGLPQLAGAPVRPVDEKGP
ncbi:MAG TPA: hypothetical protein VHU81_05730 [Thermoanaerobaculia bacterium]|nr:hypothetical protein [Thermoanaerobaculia bacterium]